jgi:hypothetical protein
MFCRMVRLKMYSTVGCRWFKENIDFFGGMICQGTESVLPLRALG